MVYVLGFISIGLLLMIAIGLVAIPFIGRKRPAPVAQPAQPPVAAFAVAPAAVLSHREQVIQDELGAVVGAYRAAEKAKFDADAVAKFKALVA